MIDTLVLSGGGPSGLSYVGVYKALLEKDILNDNIKEIITTSIGIFISFCFLIKINYTVLHQFIVNYNTNNFLNYDNLNIDNLILDLGLFKTDGIENVFRALCKNILKKNDISLQELYDISKVKLIVKVFNVTLSKCEYISYKTDPDLSIITLAKMTTAIPLFFQPVNYKDNIYVDGGLKGSLPFEKCSSKNYLAIKIHGCSDNKTEYPIINYILSLMIENDNIFNIENILHIKPHLGLNFDIDKKTIEEIIRSGYTETISFLTKE